jgi:PEP-CTERM motif
MKASHLVAIASLVLASPALATTLIVPGPATGNAQAPTPFNYYGSSGSRVQQIYASSFFPGAELIDGCSFRAYPGAAPSFFFGNSVDISDAVIQLSTTAAGADESGSLPSATFADNLGSDAKTVFSGALDLATAATETGPQPFDYTVSLPSGATVSGQGFGFLTFDTVNTIDDGIYSVVNISDGGAASGTLSTAGAITAFSVSSAAVPEPSTWLAMLTGFGILGAAMWKRRSVSTDPKTA